MQPQFARRDMNIIFVTAGIYVGTGLMLATDVIIASILLMTGTGLSVIAARNLTSE